MTEKIAYRLSRSSSSSSVGRAESRFASHSWVAALVVAWKVSAGHKLRIQARKGIGLPPSRTGVGGKV